jgi:hypothetical protein
MGASHIYLKNGLDPQELSLCYQKPTRGNQPYDNFRSAYKVVKVCRGASWATFWEAATGPRIWHAVRITGRNHNGPSTIWSLGGTPRIQTNNAWAGLPL